MTSEQIRHMVDRFLSWKLPCNFSPDAGISFEPFSEQNPLRYMPSGTNLFDAEQATAMVRYMIEGMPASTPAPTMTSSQMALADRLDDLRKKGMGYDERGTSVTYEEFMVANHDEIVATLRTSSTPAQSDGWIGLSASEKAAYDWPDDSDLHRQCRAAYVAGAIDYARPSTPAQSSAVAPPLIGTPVYSHSDGAFYGESSRPSLAVPPTPQQPVESNPPNFDGTTYGDPFQPSSENTVQVPAIPTSEMVRHGETAGYNVIGHKLSQVEGRTFADAAYRAMVGFAVSDRPGAGVGKP